MKDFFRNLWQKRPRSGHKAAIFWLVIIGTTIGLFTWGCIVTEGMVAVVAVCIFAAVYVYALIYGVVNGHI